ncbi:MAG TPA: BTAD domain-containing putative transcriptional regulator [Gemmatimonadales bacterium]|jgi:DNA-binding SARP family transcriptional activator
MLRLTTFGGLTLARGAEDLTGAATQRRRLALLALLAVAGSAGMSRDKLLAYLWPESDLERARHVLNQLLYAQRQQVGDDLFHGRKTLRLNPALIATDVGAFEQALAAGDLPTAADQYAGPFLDGFFVKEAPEFERWVEGQRTRLAQRALETMRALAESAEGAEDRGAAVTWWRRAAAIDPFDARVALRLVAALGAAGDRPGALREASRYEAGLRQELGVAPDAAFTDAVARLRGDRPT